MKALLVLLCLLTASSYTVPLTAQVIVTGIVYRLDPKNGYERLPNVRLVAFREAPTGAKAISDSTGRFELKVPDGPPFKIVFYDNDRLPEMQQLAGKAGLRNSIEVALLTPEEHQRIMGGHVPLVEKLQCVLRELPKEGPDVEEVRGIIMKLQIRLKQTR
jgi:hypothetical protein